MQTPKTYALAAFLAIALAAGTTIVQANTTKPDTMPEQTTMPCQMMQGKMMMHGPMHQQRGGRGMGCMGMMGGMMMQKMSPKQRQQFMDQTVDLRHQMMEKRFAYMEAMRHPDTSPQELARLEKEMLHLRQQMMDKMQHLQNKPTQAQ